MIIDCPTNTAPLRQLWQQAFGDTEEFLDIFFSTAYSPDRCRCLWEDGRLAAALYWFDCHWEGKKLAYLYAVATDTAFRGRGLCRALIENTHAHLKKKGYHGAILVPNGVGLFGLYEKLGYRTCGFMSTFSQAASDESIPLQEISAAEYAALRRQYLPLGSVIQEGETLALLAAYSGFYKGDNLLLTAYPENGKLKVSELLGDPSAAPGILATLGYSEGTFRTPGKDTPFAMYYPLTDDSTAPRYLGLALD